MVLTKITIYRIKKHSNNDLNKDIQWLSESLGLFGNRDREKSCFRIFVSLIKAKKDQKFISSDEIAEDSNLSRATVIHHLKKLYERGFIKHEDKRYSLSVNDFSSLIKQMEKESKELFEELEEVANNLDRKLNLKN